MNLDNRNIIITGGSSGIGKQLAILCAQKGAHVIIIARGQSLLESALEDIKSNAAKSHQRFASYALDVSDVEAVATFAADCTRDFGTVDILINNAGIAVVDHFEKTDLDDFKRVMSIDYFGAVNMTKAVLPCMKTKGSGHIVNISSMLGFMGVYGYSAYCPAKFAVSAFSEVMRYELDKYNIKVSVVYPPDVDTPQLAMCDATMPEVTRSLSGLARALSAPEAARAIIRGVEREQSVINLGFVNKAIYILNRWLPSIVARVAFSTIRRLERAA